MTDKDKTAADDLSREEILEQARKWRDAQAQGPSIEERVMEQAKQQRQIQGSRVVLDAYLEAKKKGQVIAPNTPVKSDTANDDEKGLETDPNRMALREFKIERDDNLPLVFQGYLVGWNEIDVSAVPRGTKVSIYVTRSGKIVTAVYQWQRGAQNEKRRYAAAVHVKPEEALEWLIKDGGKRLGKASRDAWELACEVWPPLQGREVEVID